MAEEHITKTLPAEGHDTYSENNHLCNFFFTRETRPSLTLTVEILMRDTEGEVRERDREEKKKKKRWKKWAGKERHVQFESKEKR